MLVIFHTYVIYASFRNGCISILLLLSDLGYARVINNYRSNVAYQDNCPFINMISFIIDKSNK